LHELASESDKDVSNNVKDKKSMEEAAIFTAEDHYNHICNILQEYYGIDIDKWLTNLQLMVWGEKERWQTVDQAYEGWILIDEEKD